jgi:hypothetical protein
MKRILLSVLVLAASISSTHAQKFYVRAGVGYAFPHAAQIAGTSASNRNHLAFISGTFTTTAPNGPEFSIKKVSFATGSTARLAGGYLFNRNIGIDLEGSFYLSPGKHKLVASSPGNGIEYANTYTQQALFPVLITPAILLRSGGENLNAYGRFGVTLPVSAQVEDQYRTDFTSSTLPSRSNSTTSIQRPKFGLGLSAAFGARYRLSKGLFVWAEASLLSMSLYAKESEVTEQTNNGVSTIDLIPQDKRIYKYGFSGDLTGSTLPAYSMPFSNIATCLGLSFDF